MNKLEIPINKLHLDGIKTWENWLLLTAGENAPGKFNPMTVSWGTIGHMWGKNIIHVVVRPTRYTYEFIEKYDTFTVTAFPPEYRGMLGLLGSKSGREIDKMKESGLTPVPSLKVAAPGYAEAELIIECRKIYYDDFNPDHFLDPEIHKNYAEKDYHRSYFGEILAVRGTEKYML